MSKKITKEDFLSRFYQRYPTAKIEILEYSAISKFCKIRCCKCNQILTRNVARQFLTGFNCCGARDETELERIKRLLDGQEEFSLVKKVNFQYVIMKHNKCGNEWQRSIGAVLDNPFSCKYCETHKKLNMLSIEDAQAQIDKVFNGSIKLLEYNGQENKNKYRCNKCGFIFEQKQVCIVASRGCPKCDRWKSNGEKFICNYLQNKNINFKEQVGIKELPLQHFDFGVYNNDNNLICFIEVQGEQHFENRFRFDPVEVQEKRDEKKRKYCKENNIPLYELIYKKGKFLNLDILPF